MLPSMSIINLFLVFDLRAAFLQIFSNKEIMSDLKLVVSPSNSNYFIGYLLLSLKIDHVNPVTIGNFIPVHPYEMILIW